MSKNYPSSKTTSGEQDYLSKNSENRYKTTGNDFAKSLIYFNPPTHYKEAQKTNPYTLFERNEKYTGIIQQLYQRTNQLEKNLSQLDKPISLPNRCAKCGKPFTPQSSGDKFCVNCRTGYSQKF